MKKISKKGILTLISVLSLFLGTQVGWSAVPSVTCTTKTPIDVGGNPYWECKGFINGTVPSDNHTYKAPITCEYPRKENQSNHTTIAYLPCYTMEETSYMDSDGNDMATIQCGNNLFTDRFIGGKGYAKCEVDWNKYVLDAAAMMDPPQPIGGYSVNDVDDPTDDDIKDPMDVHQILKDLKGLLNNPIGDISDMPKATIVIGSGFSNSNSIWNEYFLHQNPVAYDGLLQIVPIPVCMDMHYDTINNSFQSFTPCDQPMMAATAAGKMMSITTETDLQIFGAGFIRWEGPNNRHYEIPGPHVPKGMANIKEDFFSDIDLESRQNFTNPLKVIPAMTENLRLWIKNGKDKDGNDVTPPPPSVELEGWSPEGLFYTGIPLASLFGAPLAGTPFSDHFGNSPDSPLIPGGFDGGTNPVFGIARDEDGNALGGIRLPYADVPLAECNGVELGHCNGENVCSEESQANGLAFQLPSGIRPEWERIVVWEAGGYCDRFPDNKINSLYPTNKIYVNKVCAAAQNALSHRWILPEDLADYCATAKNSVIGKQSSYSDADIEAAYGVFF